MTRFARVLVALLLLACPASAQDAQLDFHDVFEARCLRCHGHAGAFAREKLRLEDGVVRGRRADLAPFLKTHSGGLSPDEIALFLAVFARQIASDGLYQKRCTICHDNARDLARLKLVLRDGVLLGRYSGRDIGAFLTIHGRLDAAEAQQMTDALTEILKGGR